MIDDERVKQPPPFQSVSDAVGELNILKNGSFVVYPSRWAMLLLFMLSAMSNSLVLLTWSPISDKAVMFWDNINITAINLLSAIFQICYIPGTILALYVSQKYDLRRIMMFGGTLTTVGCVIRWIGGFSREESNLDASGSYTLVCLGTIIVALGQPFYLNMSAKLSSAWFNTEERDTSTTLCSMANPLGKALGSAFSALFISVEPDTLKIRGVSNLLFIQLVVATCATGLVLLFFDSKPPTPPTISAGNTADQVRKKLGIGRDIIQEIYKLLQNTEYIKLLLGFSMALANFNTLAALLNQLPVHFANEEIGLTGFTLILSGFIGASFAGLVLEKTKRYSSTLRIVYTAAIVCWIIFTLSCRLDNYSFFISSAGFLGLTLLPVVPSSIVNACESSYPVAEDLTVGVMYMTANVIGVCFTFIGQELLELPVNSAGPAIFFPWALWTTAALMCGYVPVMLYKPSYLRLTHDLGSKLLSSSQPRSNDANANA